MTPTDVLVVSAANTSGWRIGAEELAASLQRAGARVQTVTANPAPRVRTFALTDLVQARTAREAALRGIAAFEPAAIVYCTIPAALLWPRPHGQHTHPRARRSGCRWGAPDTRKPGAHQREL